MFSWLFPGRSNELTKMPLPPFLQSTKPNDKKSPVKDPIRKSYITQFEILIDPDDKDMSFEDLDEVLQNWSAKYAGPHLMEKIVKTLAILSIHAIPSKRDLKLIRNGLTINSRISYSFENPDLIPTKYLDYLYSDRINFFGKSSFIKIVCNLAEDPRDGTELWELYPHGKNKINKIDLFKKALLSLGVQTSDNSESLIYI
ncbi:matrix protein [Wenzhou Myotis laniger tupavirus 1]|uniref:matrix protein n=1 Tax=Wenzhou Myotis laniger tupavirus 1 TaxID=2929005 RepID=UPI002481F665|nr:matrix protein [Wenzhou Myotis laniger tupavirus 1]UOX72921.1 matrix protein [Wenzhou Myotis laniger tupavirus 1]